MAQSTPHTYGEQAADLTEQLGRSTSDMARRGREMSDRAQSSAVEAVRERPLATLLAAAAIGFALGALWKS